MQDFINQYKDSFNRGKEETIIGGAKFKNAHISRLFALLAVVLLVIGWLIPGPPGTLEYTVKADVLRVSLWFALLGAFMMSRVVGMLLIITVAIVSILKLLYTMWFHGLLF